MFVTINKMKISNIAIARHLAGILENKKAGDVVILNVGRFTLAAEYFVIATANSQPHRTTLIDELCGKVDGLRRLYFSNFKERNKATKFVKPLRIEGKKESGWVVADYGGVMVHIMSKEERETVALENLYDGARRIYVSSTGRARRKPPRDKKK